MNKDEDNLVKTDSNELRRLMDIKNKVMVIEGWCMVY